MWIQLYAIVLIVNTHMFVASILFIIVLICDCVGLLIDMNLKGNNKQFL